MGSEHQLLIFPYLLTPYEFQILQSLDFLNVLKFDQDKLNQMNYFYKVYLYLRHVEFDFDIVEIYLEVIQYQFHKTLYL